MIKELQIPIFDLASSLSSAMDLISPVVANHHKQVAYIAFQIAAELGLPMTKRKELLLAGALHDIGAMSVQEKIDVFEFEVENRYSHADTGYRLLRMFAPFLPIANIIRYHHVYWDDGRGQESAGQSVPLASHIIHIADRIAVLINSRQEIFEQVPAIQSAITAESNRMFKAELVECFQSLSTKEFFWLDLASNLTSPYLQTLIATDTLALDSSETLSLASLFAKIIDFRSQFTATHSSGVASTAEALCKFLPFSKKECLMMRIAGYLHDLGKLAVPVEILQKPGKLTAQEWNIMRRHTYYGYHILQPIADFKGINSWASFHHERIDGTGYPFHIKGDELSLGSRVMAVADIFQAISEDRPYRKAMTHSEILRIMDNQVSNGAIDSSIVSLLKDNFDEINDFRLKAEQESLLQYKDLLVV